MDYFTLSSDFYAFVAPLPIPLANHLYHNWLKKLNVSFQEAQSRLIKEIDEHRRYLYLYMDSFVRNRRTPAPRQLRFSSEWLRQTLGMYSPDKRPLPESTLTHWIKAGFLRMEAKGKPEPDSAAALCLMRMLTEEVRMMFDGMDPSETWWCFAQDGPENEIYSLSSASIPRLPARTLLWTPWVGASWSENWLSIGDVGAIRFVGAPSSMKTQLWYNRLLENISYWKPELLSFYDPAPGCENDEIQALANLALVHLARTRMRKEK